MFPISRQEEIFELILELYSKFGAALGSSPQIDEHLDPHLNCQHAKDESEQTPVEVQFKA